MRSNGRVINSPSDHLDVHFSNSMHPHRTTSLKGVRTSKVQAEIAAQKMEDENFDGHYSNRATFFQYIITSFQILDSIL